MEIIAIISNIISLVINILLAFFGIKLLIIFRRISLRGGKPAKSWVYISAGSICLAAGVSLFLTGYFISEIAFLRYMAGAVMTLGGFLILAGFYSQYRIWRETL